MKLHDRFLNALQLIQVATLFGIALLGILPGQAIADTYRQLYHFCRAYSDGTKCFSTSEEECSYLWTHGASASYPGTAYAGSEPYRNFQGVIVPGTYACMLANSGGTAMFAMNGAAPYCLPGDTPLADGLCARTCPAGQDLQSEGSCISSPKSNGSPPRNIVLVADNVPLKGSVPACQPSSPDQIAYANGNKWLNEIDLDAGSLSFSRTYNSNPGTVGDIFGSRWRSDYGQKLASDGSANNGGMWNYRPDGRAIKHVLSGANYLPDADVSDRLFADTSNGAAYRLQLADGSMERYSADGKLLSVIDRQGRAKALVYSDGTTGLNGGFVLDAAGTPTRATLMSGLLIRVMDSYGRSLQFGYDAANRVVKLTGPAAQVYRYTYDANNNLSLVSYPDGKTKRYVYGETANTGGAVLPNALTGLIDEKNVRYATYKYNSTGKAYDGRYPVAGPNTNHYVLKFATNRTNVTDPLGVLRSYGFQTILGAPRNISQSLAGDSSCGPGSESTKYDVNGNPFSRTGFDGLKTSYTYDLSRNLELSRTEAVGMPEKKLITTQWHPFWRLPVLIVEPGKRTTYLYNGDGGSFCAPADALVGVQPIGVLCAKTEKLVPAVPGGTKTWRYTYTRYGQVLTSSEPKAGGGSEVTTYTYDPANGNLLTVRSPAGQTTTLSDYDANGRVRQIQAPDGLTTLTYKARGWLESRTQGGLATSYEYEMGQLKKVTLSGGGSINYIYDDAHRLTDITDAAGNTIHYVLDAAGNRSSEVVTDPGGTLTQALSREKDALDRLQKLMVVQ